MWSEDHYTRGFLLENILRIINQDLFSEQGTLQTSNQGQHPLGSHAVFHVTGSPPSTQAEACFFKLSGSTWCKVCRSDLPQLGSQLGHTEGKFCSIHEALSGRESGLKQAFSFLIWSRPTLLLWRWLLGAADNPPRGAGRYKKKSLED